MGANCCNHDINIKEVNKNFKKVLWIALILNFSMFLLENMQGLLAHSLSLNADAIDFFGDSANYFITLFILNSSKKVRSLVSTSKALTMFTFGVWILIEAIIHFYNKSVPDPFTMSWVGVLALIVNTLVAILLYKFRDGDSNMQSVWLCSRNDAIGNIAVILASIGVYYFSSGIPDLLVALFMSFLSISAAIKVMVVVIQEMKKTS